MKVAITGANGFLGEYLVRKCIEAEYETLALVRKSAQILKFPDSNLLVICPIDYGSLFEEFETIKKQIGEVDFFIHNAGVTVSIRKKKYFDVNANLTRKVLDDLITTKLLTSKGKFIYISSYAAHGPTGINHPVSAYGESKKKAEEMVEQCKFKYLIVRPTAIYGAGDTAFLPLFKLANNGVYLLTNPDQKMSMIHVADLASAVAAEMGEMQGIWHVSDGVIYSHTDFKGAFFSAMGKKIRTLKIPTIVSKGLLWISDIGYSLIKARPKVTLEKFEEISRDWDLQNDKSLDHMKVSVSFDLKRGFEDALKYYKQTNLI